jgi:D-glycero-D-manno-heptose 1,7-bisphosphate phosphatase
LARLERSRSARPALRPAVFLDRDGVLNEVRLDDGVPRPPASVSNLRVANGAAEALARLRDAGFVLVVITNQPDVPRGQTTRQAVDEINAALQARLPVDAVYACFHDTGDGCDCRKPRPGMLLQAARDLALDLGDSWLVGDRWVDIAAAEAVRVRGVLLNRDYSWRASSDGPPPDELRPTVTVDNIVEVANAIVAASTDGAFENGSGQSV